jgi:flavin reductase (DIM6/NTAB) family NADH-FMN oxidoreductase RutF
VTPEADVEATADAMRAARRRWASGVAVLLTRDGDGHRGATVNAFAVASLDPPLVLACLDREGRMSNLVAETGAFAVSVLDRRQEILADRFAGRAPLADPRLSGIRHRLAPSGNAVLDGALAWFDCRVRDLHDGGDHLLVVAAVESVGLGVDSDDPLLYYEGRYRGIEPA